MKFIRKYVVIHILICFSFFTPFQLNNKFLLKIVIKMENFGSDHQYHGVGGGGDNVQDTKINLVFDGANLIGLDQVTPDQVKKAVTKPKKEKPFKCSKCPCAFTELKQLEVHMTYEHYAFCDVCGIEFEDRHGLKVHMADAHMINMVDCSRCHKSFMSMEALKVHMKNDHFQCGEVRNTNALKR